MADDAMAAIYANLALQACLWSSRHFGLWSLIVQWTTPLTR